MFKKYQLVAWTENGEGGSNVKMIPSVNAGLNKAYEEEIESCLNEEKENGMDTDLALRLVSVHERYGDFLLETGDKSAGLVCLCRAAMYCIEDDDINWAYPDTDAGSIAYYCGELRHEFTRICRKCLDTAAKYKLEDILDRPEPKLMLKIYRDQLAALE
ncbi:MAG: hypothetical protein ACI3Z0_11330 [Candidatus Cryptobacteroides sp.]